MNFKLIILSLIFIGCAQQKIVELPKKEEPLVSNDQKMKCIEQLKYFKLLASLADDQSAYNKINNYDLETLCTDKHDSITKFMNTHQDKIGIIIEDDSENYDKSVAIIEGIKDSMQKIDEKKSFVVKKVKLRKKAVNKTFSELVIQEKVGIIITWGQKDFVDHIQRWQKGLNLPTLFISNKVKSAAKSFKVSPNRSNYHMKLVETLQNKNIKSVAILTESQNIDSAYMKLMKAYLKKHNIEIVHDVEYIRENYDSYDMACRKIFEIDRFKRRGEYLAILDYEKRKAKKAGFKLNPNLVFLPAKTDFEAIIIPDDFKTVHYFTKLFKYYQAKNITLVGNYQWRSADLLRPKEEFLEGALFVDFIGDYSKLPISLPEDKEDSMNIKLKADYKLMGYYSGLLSQLALKNTQQNRKLIFKKLKNIKIKDQFLGRRQAFKNNQFNWPSFLIEVSNNEFVIESAENK